jgi:hypothetical protein
LEDEKEEDHLTVGTGLHSLVELRGSNPLVRIFVLYFGILEVVWVEDCASEHS